MTFEPDASLSKTFDDTPMERSWSVREYRPGDEEGIFELHQQVKRKNDLDRFEWMRWWRWQHLDNPSGMPFIWFADAKDRLAGQYEIVRFRMRINGKEGPASHSQDTMTHPDFRRRGIFEELANRTYQQAGKTGLRLVYGFPNRYSYPGFVNKLSWFDVCKVPNVLKPLNVRNTLRRRIKNRFLVAASSVLVKAFLLIFARESRPPIDPGLTVEDASSFDDGADELWREASGGFGIICVRDRAQLNWRYVDIPHRHYRILVARRKGRMVGYAVLGLAVKEGFTGGEIIDLFAVRDDGVLRLLLSKAIEHFRTSRADAVYSWLPDSPAYKRAFRKEGFFHLPPAQLFIVRPLSKDLPKDYITDYSNWFVMMGDSDFH
jgi:GNAT superfamily N-acetyltransferase